MMEEKSYPFLRGRTDFRYEFDSISSEKTLKKVVVFSEIEENIYNLALLDELEDGKLSTDKIETKNKDFRTVMATVIQIIDHFLTKNSSFFVAFRGSDERRQRLYRLIISRELEIILKTFEVFGAIGEEQIFLFEPNQDYDYFLIKKL